jgi:hypothetical protein
MEHVRLATDRDRLPQASDQTGRRLRERACDEAMRADICKFSALLVEQMVAGQRV